MLAKELQKYNSNVTALRKTRLAGYISMDIKLKFLLEWQW